MRSFFVALSFVCCTSSLWGQTGEIYRPGRSASQETTAANFDSTRTPISDAIPAAQTSDRSTAARRELAPPSNQASGSAPRSSTPFGPLSSVAGSLAMVLAVFGACAYFLKRTQGGKNRDLAKGSFEVLGRSALAPRHQVVLLRCGERLILVGVGPTGSNTLAEFTDSNEVNRLLAACRSGESGTFQETLQQMGTQRHQPGFVGAGSNLFG